MKRKWLSIFVLALCFFCLSSCADLPFLPITGALEVPSELAFLETEDAPDSAYAEESSQADDPLIEYITLEELPPYHGDLSIPLYGNVPAFSELTTEPFETYSELDELGRCGMAYANICEELMPTEPRGQIGAVKPTGWHTVRYDDLISDKYLYNRCHLIAFSLAGENDNERNLITGTRYFNVSGMVPWENRVASYVTKTHGHVLYRVSPLFEGGNLLATGVQIEALSVEDHGEAVCFNVFVYNVQPGIVIDYATGDSWVDSANDAEPTPSLGDIAEAAPSAEDSAVSEAQDAEITYVVNISSKRFHLPDCPSVAEMKDKNRLEVGSTREELIAEGYVPCGFCHP